jgi:hypothetical protein
MTCHGVFPEGRAISALRNCVANIGNAVAS